MFIIKQISEELLLSTLQCLVDVVNSEGATLASIAMQALGHIGLYAPLPSLICDSSPGKAIHKAFFVYCYFCSKGLMTMLTNN